MNRSPGHDTVSDADLEDFFNSVLLDGNGCLTDTGFRQMLKQTDTRLFDDREPTLDDLKEFLKFISTKSDGQVDVQEFIRSSKQIPTMKKLVTNLAVKRHAEKLVKQSSRLHRGQYDESNKLTHQTNGSPSNGNWDWEDAEITPNKNDGTQIYESVKQARDRHNTQASPNLNRSFTTPVRDKSMATPDSDRADIEALMSAVSHTTPNTTPARPRAVSAADDINALLAELPALPLKKSPGKSSPGTHPVKLSPDLPYSGKSSSNLPGTSSSNQINQSSKDDAKEQQKRKQAFVAANPEDNKKPKANGARTQQTMQEDTKKEAPMTATTEELKSVHVSPPMTATAQELNSLYVSLMDTSGNLEAEKFHNLLKTTNTFISSSHAPTANEVTEFLGYISAAGDGVLDLQRFALSYSRNPVLQKIVNRLVSISRNNVANNKEGKNKEEKKVAKDNRDQASVDEDKLKAIQSERDQLLQLFESLGPDSSGHLKPGNFLSVLLGTGTHIYGNVPTLAEVRDVLIFVSRDKNGLVDFLDFKEGYMNIPLFKDVLGQLLPLRNATVARLNSEAEAEAVAALIGGTDDSHELEVTPQVRHQTSEIRLVVDDTPYDILPNMNEERCRNYPQVTETNLHALFDVMGLDHSGTYLDPKVFLEILHMTDTQLVKGNKATIVEVTSFLSLVSPDGDMKVNFESFKNSVNKIPTLTRLVAALMPKLVGDMKEKDKIEVVEADVDEPVIVEDDGDDLKQVIDSVRNSIVLPKAAGLGDVPDPALWMSCSVRETRTKEQRKDQSATAGTAKEADKVAQKAEAKREKKTEQIAIDVKPVTIHTQNSDKQEDAASCFSRCCKRLFG